MKQLSSSGKCIRAWLGMLLTVLAILALAGCGSPGTPTNGGTQITDSAGRQLVLPDKIERVAVFNAYNAELLNAIGVLDKVVAVDDYIYKDAAGFDHRFTESMNVGKEGNQLNYERLIALKPQILIMTGNSAEIDKIEKKLQPFHIQVVVVNAYYTNEFAQNCDLLGKIFHKEKEANELKHYFLDKLDYIQKQLKNVPKRTLYFEYRRAGLTTVPGDYFYWMVEYSGAENIFRQAKGREIDPEQVIVKNPQYIVKVSDPVSRSSYLPPTPEQMREIKAELVNRPGWDEIDAVQHDRILLLSHYIHGGASKLVGTMYIAKFMYPEYLPDLHPEQVFKDWLVKYQHLDYIAGHTMPAFEIPKEK